MSLKSPTKSFWLMLFIMYIIAEIRMFSTGVWGMCAESFAISYRYGFVSRGLPGTILNLIAAVFGEQAYTNITLRLLASMMLIIYFTALILLFKKVLDKTNYGTGVMIYLLVFASVYIERFIYGIELGRQDQILLALSIYACLILMKKKFLPLTVILCSLAMMIHQGYVFLYFNIFFAFMVYKVSKEKNRSLLITLITTCSAVLLLFFWFEIGSHMYYGVNTAAYEDAVELCRKIMKPGDNVADTVLKHELLGEDLYEFELPFQRREMFLDLPVFIILFLPIILFGMDFFRKCMKELKDKKGFLFMNFCSGAVLPLFILKLDYGRWVFALFMFFFLLPLMRIADGDNDLGRLLDDHMRSLREKAIFLGLYTAALMPFGTIEITAASDRICSILEKLIK